MLWKKEKGDSYLCELLFELDLTEGMLQIMSA
jgi:hypothetical protein